MNFKRKNIFQLSIWIYFSLYYFNCNCQTINQLLSKSKEYSKNGNYNSEIETYKLILNRYSNNPKNQLEIANTLSQLTNTYIQIGDFENALTTSNNGIQFSKKNGLNDELIKNMMLKIKVLLMTNKTNEALSEFDNNIDYLKKINEPDLLIDIYRNRAYLHENLGEGKKAINYFNLAKKIKEKRGESSVLVDLDIGYAYYEYEKNYDKALYHYNLGLKNNTDDYFGLRLYDNIGAVYWKLGKFDLALENYQQGFIQFKRIKFSNKNVEINPEFEVLKNMELKDFFLTHLFDKAICWQDYYKVSKNKSHLKNALQTYVLVSQLIDYMRQEHQATESKYFWRNKTRPIYESAIETCLLLKDYEKAFYFFEKSRSVMLNDKLNEMGAKQKLSVQDQKKEREFISKILALNADIEKEKDVKKKENLISKQNDLVESQSQFTKSLETKNPAYYQMKYDTNTVSLGQMQDYLKKNFKGKPATIAEYFMGNSATYALVVSTNIAEIKKLNYDSKLADSFLSLSSRSLNIKAELDSFNHISLALNNQLIKPLNIPKGHLIISQDGSFLPFEALVNSSKKGDYLVNDYSISYTYSAQFLLKNKSENNFFPNKNFIGFAPVNFSNLASLNGSKKSISNLADHYFFNKKLVEKEATKNNFLAQANSFKIVQLYTHAKADSNETEPRIYFADSTLKVSELSAENQFKTQMLVLSACKTGVGKLAKGEGILSLARGFSMLGIPATITSLWSVEDADTYKITELFYDFLNKGFGKDDALQKAKIEFINLSGNPQPYAWAGMVLVGETEPIGHSKAYLWLIAAILTIGILGFLLVKSKYLLSFRR